MSGISDADSYASVSSNITPTSTRVCASRYGSLSGWRSRRRSTSASRRTVVVSEVRSPYSHSQSPSLTPIPNVQLPCVRSRRRSKATRRAPRPNKGDEEKKTISHVYLRYTIPYCCCCFSLSARALYMCVPYLAVAIARARGWRAPHVHRGCCHITWTIDVYLVSYIEAC